MDKGSVSVESKEFEHQEANLLDSTSIRKSLGPDALLLCNQDATHRQEAANAQLRELLKVLKNKSHGANTSSMVVSQRDGRQEPLGEYIGFSLDALVEGGSRDNTCRSTSERGYSDSHNTIIPNREKMLEDGEIQGGTSNHLQRSVYRVVQQDAHKPKLVTPHAVASATQSPPVEASGFFSALHDEVVGLLHWLELTEEEDRERLKILARVTIMCTSLWPQCKVRWFGSYLTGLSLPNSDLDVCVSNVQGNRKVNLQVIADCLQQHALVVPNSIELILDARVPIVKFAAKHSGIRVDISINEESGLKTSAFVREQLLKFPYLRPLIMINKLFLQQKHFGETFTGGIGSYLLFVMCLSFMQQRCNLFSTNNNEGLGQLLFQFYRYYGFDFDYKAKGISVINNGRLYPKHQRGWHNGGSTLLTVECPLNNSNNIGHPVHKLELIRSIWKATWTNLRDHSVKYTPVYPESTNKSKDLTFLFLKNVINSQDLLFEFRHRKAPLDKATSVSALRDIPIITKDIFAEVEQEMRLLRSAVARPKNSHDRKRSSEYVKRGELLKFQKYIF